MTDTTYEARAARIARILTVLAPTELEIINESARHAGHSGDDGSGETHYRITIVSAQFVGLSRVAQQRLIYDLLSEEFNQGLHSLSLHVKNTISI